MGTSVKESGRRGHWRKLTAVELDDLPARLLQTDASCRQFPYWYESHRSAITQPAYLVYEVDSTPDFYLSMQVIRIPFFKLGVTFQGPIRVTRGAAPTADSLEALVEWADRRGIFALKFGGVAPILEDTLMALEGSTRDEVLPYYGNGFDRLTVDLQRDEATLLASFQPIARREIKQAQKQGYEISASSNPDDFVEALPLILSRHAEKGVRAYRMEDNWIRLFKSAAPDGCARIYTAKLDGLLIQAALVLRDQHASWYVLGGIDLTALGDARSPACLLQWAAMQDAAGMGCSRYELGGPVGTVTKFKMKFHPTYHEVEPTVALVVRPQRFSVWKRYVLPVAKAAIPALGHGTSRARAWRTLGRLRRA